MGSTVKQQKSLLYGPPALEQLNSQPAAPLSAGPTGGKQMKRPQNKSAVLFGDREQDDKEVLRKLDEEANQIYQSNLTLLGNNEDNEANADSKTNFTEVQSQTGQGVQFNNHAADEQKANLKSSLDESENLKAQSHQQISPVMARYKQQLREGSPTALEN
mmetsp:Transcript_5559/g.9527  ORF Transcript_5559/g.9527 Transcript_5559/m.9527 type:complete len:160 (-) Transcript_5559:61-540(-)